MTVIKKDTVPKFYLTNKTVFNKAGEKILEQASSTDSDSSIYVCIGLDGVRCLIENMIKDHLNAKGIRISDADEKYIRKYANDKVENAKNEYRAKGFPGNLKLLFNAKSKAEAMSSCKRIVINNDDIASACINSEDEGFKYSLKKQIFVPEHLQFNDEDYKNLERMVITGEMEKKAKGTFLESKRIFVHLFERGREWHFIYFSFSDTFNGTNHWVKGPHVHYVGWHWSGLDKNKILDQFDNRKNPVPSEHIEINFV